MNPFTKYSELTSHVLCLPTTECSLANVNQVRFSMREPFVFILVNRT